MSHSFLTACAPDMAPLALVLATWEVLWCPTLTPRTWHRPGIPVHSPSTAAPNPPGSCLPQLRCRTREGVHNPDRIHHPNRGTHHTGCEGNTSCSPACGTPNTWCDGPSQSLCVAAAASGRWLWEVWNCAWRSSHTHSPHPADTPITQSSKDHKAVPATRCCRAKPPPDTGRFIITAARCGCPSSFFVPRLAQLGCRL